MSLTAWRHQRWQVAPLWAGREELARSMRTSPLVAQLLYNRGLSAREDIGPFLSPKLTDLHDPRLLPGIDQAVERLIRAVKGGESICIYGDYDVDGMTGTAILYRCLKMHGANVSYYIPHRLDEGYGVNVEAVEKIAAAGAKLLLTVDCGITADVPLARAAKLGMEVIVTDHHSLGPTLPPALAVVHPALIGSTYPNPDLCGAAVAFKLAWHFARTMRGSERVDEPTRKFLLEATSLAALGVIADVMPLTGENRVLAVYGLKGLAVTEHVGIRALLESANLVGEKLDAFHVGFTLAPRLNACGRMGHAELAVELLTRADGPRCRQIAQHLEQANIERQKIEREIAEQARAMYLAGGLTGPDDAAVVVAKADWHAGVVGIVASRLVEQFRRPAIVLTVTGDVAHGSGRSIRGLHMRDAMAACGGLLTSFGGHAMAGGLRLPAANLPAFAKAFAAYAGRNLRPEDMQSVLHVDAECALSELDVMSVEQVHRLAPFGQGNPRPVVAIRNGRILAPPTRMGKTGNAVSFVICDAASTGSSAGRPASGGSNGRIRCVGFQMGELAEKLSAVNIIDLAGEPVLNHYNGRTTAEFHIKDVAWEQ